MKMVIKSTTVFPEVGFFDTFFFSSLVHFHWSACMQKMIVSSIQVQQEIGNVGFPGARKTGLAEKN